MRAETDRLHSLLITLPRPRCVLEIGPGAWPAAAICRAVWGAHTRVVGLDWDTDALSRAPSGALWTVCGDASLPPLAMAAFDLILIRHPDLNRHPARWQTAIQRFGRAFRGLFALTCYTQDERAMIVHWLEPLALSTFRLEESALAPPGLSGRDAQVLVFQADQFRPYSASRDGARL